MSRSSLQKQMKEETQILDKMIVNSPEKYDNTERVLLIDGDSLMFLATYNPVHSDIEMTLEEVQFRLEKKKQEIILNVERYYNIKEVVMYIGGKKNHRYELYSDYKAHRKKQEKPPFFKEAREYLENVLGGVSAPLGEADDLIYEAYVKCNKQCVIASPDKDLFYICHSVPHYSYLSKGDVLGEFRSLSEKESRLAFATQVLIGDSGDGINFTKGIGPAYAKKVLNQEMSDFQFMKAILKSYQTLYDSTESKRLLRLTYNLVRMWTQNEIKSLNLYNE
jgi:5'-3' exonuclease